MPNVELDESKFNKFYVVSKVESKSWQDVAIFVGDWCGRLANEYSDGDRKSMYNNSYYLPNLQEPYEVVHPTIEEYGYWIGRCYCRKPRTGGIVNGNLYFIVLNESVNVYEFGVITIDGDEL